MKYGEWQAQQAEDDTDCRADVGIPVVVHTPATNLPHSGKITQSEPAHVQQRLVEPESSGRVEHGATISKQRAFELALTADLYYDLASEDMAEVQAVMSENGAEFQRVMRPAQKTTKRAYEIL